MHGISLMSVKETEGIVEALAQTSKYEKQTRLKKVLKNVIEITAGGDYIFACLRQTYIFHHKKYLAFKLSTRVYLYLGILMHNIIKNRLDIINEILRKLPEGTDPDFVERDE